MDDDLQELSYAEELEHRRLEEMEPINELATALAKAQAEMKNPGFDTTNPHFKSKFASLAAVRNAVIPVLAKNGIAVVQDIETRDNAIACTTILVHASGQSMAFGPLVIPATKPDAQGLGSATTYARRYSLQAVVGVVGDEDDDANAASEKSHYHDPRGEAWKKQDTKLVNEYHKRILSAIEASNDEDAFAIWREASEDHDFAIALWATLPKPIKTKLQDLKDREAA